MPLMGFELVVLAASISMADLRDEFAVPPRDQAMVQDAIKRWNKKAGPQSDMDLRVPIVIYLRDRRCVVLHLRATAIGGTPSYCYRLKEDVLVEAVDDIE